MPPGTHPGSVDDHSPPRLGPALCLCRDWLGTMNDGVVVNSLGSVENDRSGLHMQPTSARCANYETPQGASTSRLPSDGGTASYKGLGAAPLEANFVCADPPPAVVNMIGQQLATADDMVRQAINMTELCWAPPSTQPSSLAPTMLISDLCNVRAQLQTIICRLGTPAAPGTQSHAAAVANATPQLVISSFPDSAEYCSIAPDLVPEAAARMHQDNGMHGRCSSNLPADELGRSGAPTGAVRALSNAFDSNACVTGEYLAVAPVTPQDNGSTPLPSDD